MPGDRTLPRLTPAKLSTAGVNLFLAEEFPRIAIGRLFTVEETRYGFARMRMHYGDRLPRRGGTLLSAGGTLTELFHLSVMLLTQSPGNTQQQER